MLWIDGVGGFLVVAGDEWLIGGPGAGRSVEINVHGDLSRRAAAIRRQGGDYILQPLGQTRMTDEVPAASDIPAPLTNALLDRPNLLRDGTTFQLGDSVQFRFRQPHRLSSSARLDLISRHRTQPRTDGVILLADTCVIGRSQDAHIVCSAWSSDVVLFAIGDDWHLRSDEALTVDGNVVGRRAKLPPTCRIEGESLAMSLESACAGTVGGSK